MNAITQAPQRCPLDLEAQNLSLDFPHYWQRAAVLANLPQSMRELDIAGAGLARLLKRLHSLDTPRRALLLTMACMANPQRAAWLQAEVGMHVGQLTAADLGPEVFQTLVGLLATFKPTPSN